MSNTISRTVAPIGTSTSPGLRTRPLNDTSLVPGEGSAPTSDSSIGRLHRVSTLFITVGLPQSPDSTGKGGLVRGTFR